jgi:hypothetical protein
MEGSCSTGQSPQWPVVPVEEEEEEEEEEDSLLGNIGVKYFSFRTILLYCCCTTSAFYLLKVQ